MSVTALCIGHATYDLCFVVDRYPTENSKAQTDLLLESSGGPAANAAWLLASWGVPTALAALVGADDPGRRILKELADVQVDCRLVEQRPGGVTPVSAIITNRLNGSRTIINRKPPGTALQLEAGALRGLAPQLMLFDGHELEASLTALEAFPNALTVLDAGSLREGTRELSRRVDYLVSSQRFATQITGQQPADADWPQAARALQQLNGKIAVITLGEHGCVFDNGREQGHLPARAVRTVDTTGAGDVFHGAFAHALLQRKELVDALRFATVAAGLSVQHFGGRPSIPDLPTVLQEMLHD